MYSVDNNYCYVSVVLEQSSIGFIYHVSEYSMQLLWYLKCDPIYLHLNFDFLILLVSGVVIEKLLTVID